MDKNGLARSPLFYVGDKYKLMAELREIFPENIDHFVEPFVGGGSVFLNVAANKYVLNDYDTHVIDIHKYLSSYRRRQNELFANLFQIIDSYSLSCSYLRDDIPEQLKRELKKTYFAEYNRSSFGQLKRDYNNSPVKDVAVLYLLLIYGFNRMLRFNSKGEYNLPVGNVDFNGNTYEAICDYLNIVRGKKISWKALDFREFFRRTRISQNDFVYLDPPYLITFSEYNKFWDETTERDLLGILDQLNERGIRFAISNVTHYKGKTNDIFIQWASNYTIHPIHSNYISYHDNTIKTFKEVLVTNY